MLVRAHTEVLDRLTGVPLTPQEDSVGTGGRAKRKLVKGDSLTTGFEDALLGRLREAEGGNGELGNIQDADIIGDSANLDNDF